ncbi:MAG: diguanylate cyclase [Pseudobutyrivibrio sp.]|nr:diguanylate cyclase [Pseudobutyrivibrio sp.]
MDVGFIKKIIVALYIIIIIFLVILGFAYSNQDSGTFRENFIQFDEGWKDDDVELSFPYDFTDEFTMVNELPQVYGDQFLIIKCFYETATVCIDDVEIYRTRDNSLFGISSNVGKKEIHIPMKTEYSGKKVSVKLKLQDSLYGAEVYDILISTRSGYGIYIIKSEWISIVFAVVLLFSGMMEAFVGMHFIVKRSLILRKLSFEALVFSGVFSILSSIWLICQTRILYVIFGNGTGFAILEIIVFLLMPLAFFELVRSVNFRVSVRDNIIDGILAITIMLLFILSMLGALHWGEIVIIGHAIDLIVVFFVAYYSYTSIKEEKRQSERKLIAIGNMIFLLVCLVALAMYINNVDSNYNVLVVLGLIIYTITQVSLIYRRIGLKVEEEAELVQAKEFAYTDELTKLTNRRYFYEELKALEDREVQNDTTIVYYDVNRLKYYNDEIGHDAGDELLVAMADCLRKAFSDCSTSVISRIGGDEFIVMLIDSESDINRRIEKFKALSSQWTGEYIKGFTASYGVAARREYKDASLEDLCKLADNKMYEDKKRYYEETGYDRRHG